MEASPPEAAPKRILFAIPAYREAARLPQFLEKLLPVLERHPAEVRVAVCDDGSGAEQQQRLRERLARLESRVLLPVHYLEENVGKGGAILAAWDAHPGYDAYAFVDADGAVPPHEVARLAAMYDGGSALFGARVRMMGRTMNRSLHRHLIGRVFNELVELFIEPTVYDSQCGLKLLPASALRAMRPWLKGRRFAFDVELIAALRVLRCSVREVPIDWSHVPGSKVSFLRDTFRMARAVLEIRREMGAWQQEEKPTPTR